MDPSLIHRLFYPQVPLVLAAQHGGRVSAMPVVSYLSLSDKPPTVGVSCMPKGFTCKLAVRARSFSLSVLDSSLVGAISGLATVSGAQVNDKLSAIGLAYTTGKKAKVPVLKGAAATIECALASAKRVGEHLLLVGRVQAAYASEGFTDFWDYSKYRPILYAGWKGGLTLFPGT